MQLEARFEIRGSTASPHLQWGGRTREGADVGWVPGPLLPLLERAGAVSADVAHANRIGTNPHLRLLVRLRGELIRAAHFDDPRWDLVG